MLAAWSHIIRENNQNNKKDNYKHTGMKSLWSIKPRVYNKYYILLIKLPGLLAQKHSLSQ